MYADAGFRPDNPPPGGRRRYFSFLLLPPGEADGFDRLPSLPGW